MRDPDSAASLVSAVRDPARPDRRRTGSAAGTAAIALAALVAAATLPSLAATVGEGATPPAAAAASAASAASAADADAQAAALARAYRAVVGLRTLAVGDARSNETLGRLRRGSAVVIDAEGLLLTIGYLILEADQVDLLLPAGRVVPAAVAGYDPATGFGLVRALAPLRIEPVPLGRSAALADGAPLMVASAAAGGGQTGGASLARLLSRRAFAGSWEYRIEDALYTAPARIDHSGAALFNADGELLGIGSLVVADALGDGRPPVLPGNMFVPVDLLLPVLAELRRTGSSGASRRAWLGVNCVEVASGLRVLRIGADSPAAAAGLQPGDRIAAIDGRPVITLAGFYDALWNGGPPEREVSLDVERDGVSRPLVVHATDRLKALRRATGI